MGDATNEELTEAAKEDVYKRQHLSTIGSRIRNRREELGLSQDELGKRLGYKSRSSINKIELDPHFLTVYLNIRTLLVDGVNTLFQPI